MPLKFCWARTARKVGGTDTRPFLSICFSNVERNNAMSVPVHSVGLQTAPSKAAIQKPLFNRCRMGVQIRLDNHSLFPRIFIIKYPLVIWPVQRIYAVTKISLFGYFWIFLGIVGKIRVKTGPVKVEVGINPNPVNEVQKMAKFWQKCRRFGGLDTRTPTYGLAKARHSKKPWQPS